MSDDYILYKETKYYVQSTGKYYQSRYKVLETRSLHRRIWIENYGEIPKGFDVHHIDGNWRNNSLENLCIINHSDHISAHMKKLMSNKEFRSRAEKGRLKAIEEAKKWHKSDKGRDFHSKQALDMWANKKLVPVVCSVCGEIYFTYFPTRSKYCSSSCCNKHHYVNTRKIDALCVVCGKKYLKDKYRNKTNCCSRSCSAKYRWKNHDSIVLT